MKTLLSFSQLKGEQVFPIFEQARGVLISNALVTIFLMFIFWNEPGQDIAWVWGSSAFVFTVASFLAAHYIAQKPIASINHFQRAQFMFLTAAMRGIIWGLGLFLLMPVASASNQLILGWLLAGVMCGGAFAYWPLPIAALAFSFFVALGGALGMIFIKDHSVAAAVVPTLAMFLMLNKVVFWNARFLRDGINDRESLHTKNEVISLLLRDFEESSTDWLWEINDQGKLARGAGPFARLFGVDEALMVRQPILDICRNSITRDPTNDGLVHVIAALEGKTAFSDLILKIGIGESASYIELSAKPILSSLGLVCGWRGAASDKTQLYHDEAKIFKLAHYDSLTGLPNRTQFYADLNAMLLQPLNDDIWLFYLDLDGFKAVNDTYGHGVGDQLLVAVTQRLNTDPDFIGDFARLGGDEFAWLGQGSADIMQNKWRKMVSLVSSPFEIGCNMLSVGVSVGIAKLDPHVNTADELVRRADMALYQAKNDGRGTARVYDASMEVKLHERRRLERDLRLALQLSQLVLYYQPFVSMHDRSILGYEALLRWQHPQHGLIMPDKFIEIAEDTGLINDIGEWVLLQATKDAMAWQENTKVSVNVSPLQLKSVRILSSVTHALAKSGLRPSRLELEITESALIEDADRVGELCKDLKLLGVGIVLDDFGTGYSSLSHLHQFSFDKIKIDRSFVQAFAMRKESAAVIKAVLMLAKELNILTTAEGIETEPQYLAMTALGCNQAQGYLIGRPAPQRVESLYGRGSTRA